MRCWAGGGNERCRLGGEADGEGVECLGLIDLEQVLGGECCDIS